MRRPFLRTKADAETRAGASAAGPPLSEGSPLVGGRGNDGGHGRARSSPRKWPGREWRHGSAPGSTPGRRGHAGFDRPQALSAGRAAPPPPVRPSAPLTAPPSAPAPPTAPPTRSVPLVVARSLRGAESLRPGFGAPAAPAAWDGRTAGAAGADSGPGSSLRRPHDAASSGIAGWPRKAGRVARRSPRRRPPRGPDDGAGPAGERLAVSRLADGGDSAPPPAAGVLGWSAVSGFAALPAVGPAMVQRAVVVDEVATQVEAAPAAGPMEGGTGNAGTGGAGQDYEEIADRVYDRIRSRFATELLLDRERMGLLIDG